MSLAAFFIFQIFEYIRDLVSPVLVCTVVDQDWLIRNLSRGSFAQRWRTYEREWRSPHSNASRLLKLLKPSIASPRACKRIVDYKYIELSRARASTLASNFSRELSPRPQNSSLHFIIIKSWREPVEFQLLCCYQAYLMHMLSHRPATNSQANKSEAQETHTDR